MSGQTTELGDWVKQFFGDLIFQPDDELSQKRISDSLDSTFEIRVNGDTHSREVYVSRIAQARAKSVISREEARELLHAEAETGGSVAHIHKYNFKNKETGQITTGSFVSIATVAEKEGKRVMTHLAEVLS